MAAASGRKSPPLTQQLFDQPNRFEFFQAVRLLELLGRRERSSGDAERPATVGFDLSPEHEPVRFVAHASQAFPPSSIVELGVDRNGAAVERFRARPPQMTVSFMGLTGPQGVLPDHYTRLLIERIRDDDNAMRDFFDLFNHRFVSLAYRAWAKYRLVIQYERAKRIAVEAEPDPVTHALFCFVGMGTRYLRGRLTIDDETLLYYGGHMASARPVTASLELMLREYFAIPLVLQPFQGRWLALSVDEHSRLSSSLDRTEAYCQLGTSAWVGRRVWDVQSKFRVRLGPLNYARFRSFLPIGRSFAALCQFIRLYVGPEFDFDIQLVLLASEVPRCRLGGTADDGNLLGWNSWLRGRPLSHNAESAIFCGDGISGGAHDQPVGNT
jgi:type VI secretion system protein ImpH